jgi:hypothetical protein
MDLTVREDMQLRPLKQAAQLTTEDKQQLQRRPTPMNPVVVMPPAEEPLLGEFRANERHERNPNPTSLTQPTADVQLQTHVEDLSRKQYLREEFEHEQARLQKLASGSGQTVTQEALHPIQLMPSTTVDPAEANRRNQELQQLRPPGAKPNRISVRQPTSRFMENQP